MNVDTLKLTQITFQCLEIGCSEVNRMWYRIGTIMNRQVFLQVYGGTCEGLWASGRACEWLMPMTKYMSNQASG